MSQSPSAIRLLDQNGRPLDVSDGVAVPASTSALIHAVVDPTGPTSRYMRGDANGRPDVLMGSWLGSAAPTVGQKTMANSLPIALASDQTAINVSSNGMPQVVLTNATLTSFGVTSISTNYINVPINIVYRVIGPATGSLTLQAFDIDPQVNISAASGTGVFLTTTNNFPQYFTHVSKTGKILISYLVSGGSFAGVYVTAVPRAIVGAAVAGLATPTDVVIVGGADGSTARQLYVDSSGRPYVILTDGTANFSSVVNGSTRQLAVAAEQNNPTSVSNVSTANLNGGATFTGSAEGTFGYNSILVSLFATQPCLVQVQQSQDASNWDVIDQYTTAANLADARAVQAVARFYRILVTNNGGLATTSFRLQSVLSPDTAILPRTLGTTTSANSLSVVVASDQALTTQLNGLVSSNNSSTANLNSGATYTGASESTLHVDAVQVSLFADQACTVQVQQSSNGTNWDISDSYTVAASTGDGRTFAAVASTVRVLVTNNGGVATTSLRLQTVLKPVATPIPRALGQQTKAGSSSVVVASDQVLIASVEQDRVVSTNNSSTANLNASATFTGTSDNTINVGAIQVNLFATQACTVQVQQSTDNSNWDISDSYTVAASTGDGRSIKATANYARVLVTNNGGIATTSLRLQTVLCPMSEAQPRTIGQKTSANSLSVVVASDQVLTASIEQDRVVSTNNSSTANLNSLAVFTGTSDNTINVGAVQVNLFANQPCTVQVQQSPDNSNWDINDSFSTAASVGDGRIIAVTANYVRVLVTNNGGGATTSLRLQTVLLPIGAPLPRTIGQKTSANSLSVVVASDQTVNTLVAQNRAVSTNNSSTSNLNSGATFTGAFDYTLTYGAIEVNLFATQACTVQVQQSTDSVNFDIIDSYTVAASTGDARSVKVTANYARVLVTNNGGIATTSLRLQTILCPISESIPRALGQTVKAGSLSVAIASDQTVPVSGTVTATAPASATATKTTVASSATSGTILASNASRKGAMISNRSTQSLFLLFGSGTASSTNFTVELVPHDYYEIPFNFTGVLTGVWGLANGDAQVTELT